MYDEDVIASQDQATIDLKLDVAIAGVREGVT